MDRVNGADYVDIGGGRRGFRSQNLAGGVSGTEVTAAWLNALQENILKVIEAAGLAPDINDWDLLWKALNLAENGRADFPVEGWQSAPPAAPSQGARYVVLTPGAGAWINQGNMIAIFVGAAWVFTAPIAGLQVQYWSGRQIVLRYDGASWAEDLASETAAGRVELATSPETRAGTDAQRAVTPAGLFASRSVLRAPETARWSSPGTYSWTVPADVTKIYGIVTSAGGGGGGQKGDGIASGGGGGGRAEGAKAVTPGQIITITVGAGGAPGAGSTTTADPTNGGAGGSSSIGSLMSATGGGGGLAAASGIQGSSGAQGVGSGGDINRAGFGGGTGFSNIGGQGGGLYGTSSSPLNSGAQGQPGYGPGGGGSGASGGGTNGGAGADGEVIIQY